MARKERVCEREFERKINKTKDPERMITVADAERERVKTMEFASDKKLERFLAKLLTRLSSDYQYKLKPVRFNFRYYRAFVSLERKL